MLKTKSYIVVSLLVILSTLATSCAAPKPAALSNDDVLTIAQNALTALDANDFTAFTRDFGPDMKASYTEAQFIQLSDLLQPASGEFVSIGKISLSNNQGYAIYRIICKYEREDVVVTLVFKIDGKQIEGLFFDSPNLRTATQQ